MNEVIDLLADSELFQGIDREALAVIAPTARARTLEKGTVLFSYGDERLAFFLVVRGEVELRGEDGGSTETLVLLGPGRTIGEAGLLEDPDTTPPPEMFNLTRSPFDAPDQAVELEIHFGSRPGCRPFEYHVLQKVAHAC